MKIITGKFADWYNSARRKSTVDKDADARREIWGNVRWASLLSRIISLSTIVETRLTASSGYRGRDFLRSRYFLARCIQIYVLRAFLLRHCVSSATFYPRRKSERQRGPADVRRALQLDESRGPAYSHRRRFHRENAPTPLRHGACMEYRKTTVRAGECLRVLKTAFQTQACISGARGKIRTLFRHPRKIACRSPIEAACISHVIFHAGTRSIGIPDPSGALS